MTPHITAPSCVLALTLLAPLAATSSHAQAVATETFILTHANIIDGVSAAPTMDTTVVVADGRIKSIGETSAREGRIIDLKGRWLLPGFVDAHVHVGDIQTARRAIESGATTIASAGISHFADVGLRELNHGGAADIPEDRKSVV